MFERFSQTARRAIFFARQEADQRGSQAIESEHLLLGAVSADAETLREKLGLVLDPVALSAAIEAAAAQRGKPSPSVYPQFSDECKRALELARDESEALRSESIGVEHIALGILREDSCLAATLLRKAGLELEKARTLAAGSQNEGAVKGGRGARAGGGIGSGGLPESMSRFAVEVQILHASTLDVLLISRSLTPHIPRAGESILIRDGANAPQAYTVQNVVWEFEQTGGSGQLREVKVLVVKERAL